MVVYRFQGCELNLSRRELRVGGSPVEIEPRPFDVLAYLLLHRDRLVSRRELATVIWKVEHISASAISKAVWGARQALGDQKHQRVVITLYGRGYRIGSDVEVAVLERNGSAAC